MDVGVDVDGSAVGAGLVGLTVGPARGALVGLRDGFTLFLTANSRICDKADLSHSSNLRPLVMSKFKATTG